MPRNYARLLYGLGVAVFLNPFAWVFIIPPVLVDGFSLSMLYQVAISIIGFTLITKFIKDDIAEFGFGFRRALLQSLIYLALCLIVPIGELGFIYVVMGFPPHLITTPGDSLAFYMATYVPAMITVVLPIYAFAITSLGMRWSKSAMKNEHTTA
jgi:hypothetical protein